MNRQQSSSDQPVSDRMPVSDSTAPVVERDAGVIRRQILGVAAAMLTLLASSAWFCWLQPARPNPLERTTLTSWSWWWYPLERHAWLRLPTFPAEVIADIHARRRGNLIWVVLMNDAVLHSQDGGQSWVVQQLGPRYAGPDVKAAAFFVPESSGRTLASDPRWRFQTVSQSGGKGFGDDPKNEGLDPRQQSPPGTGSKNPKEAGESLDSNSASNVEDEKGGANNVKSSTPPPSIDSFSYRIAFSNDRRGVVATPRGEWTTDDAGENWIHAPSLPADLRELLDARRSPVPNNVIIPDAWCIEVVDDKVWIGGRWGELLCRDVSGDTWAPLTRNAVGLAGNDEYILPFEDPPGARGGRIQYGMSVLHSLSARDWDYKRLPIESGGPNSNATPGSEIQKDGTFPPVPGRLKLPAAPLKYQRYPAPLWYVSCLFAVLMPLPFLRRRTITSPKKSIADRYVSDRPLESPVDGSSDLARLARGLSNYVRNENTGTPLVVAVTGAWGSGKSSLMNLVREDLAQRGFFPVWFNAWHHQNEESLLAALLANMRSQAVPGLFSREGLLFRAKLLWHRYRRRPLWVLGNLALAAAILAGLSQIRDWGSLDLTDFNEKTLFTEKTFQKLISLGALGTLVQPLWFMYRFLQAFGVNPGELLSGNQGKAAEAERQTSFRYRFAIEFAEVTRVLRPRTMVIFVDDLDRCQPAHMMSVLESVNFLATSGDCVIVIGMEERAVLDCLTTQFQWRLEVEKERIPADQLLERKRAYARLWLEKLIQVTIPVPTLSDEESRRLVTGRKELLASQAPTARTGTSWLQAVMRLAVMMLIPVLLALIGFQVGQQIGQSLPGQRKTVLEAGTAAPTERESSDGKSTGAKDPASAWPRHVEAEGTFLGLPWSMRLLFDSSPLTASPGSEGSQGPPPFLRSSHRPQDTKVSPGAHPPTVDWSSATILAGLLAMAAFVGWWSSRRSLLVVVADSDAFQASVQSWWSVIAENHRTPRALKRFLNRLRFYAMLVRDTDNPESEPVVAEPILVGFGVLESCRREELQSALGSADSPEWRLTQADQQQAAQQVVEMLHSHRETDELRQLLSSIRIEDKIVVPSTG